jgi:hypothetical protein
MGTFTTLVRPQAAWPQWADLINHRPVVTLQSALLARFEPISGYFHPIESGFGEVNLDVYPVRVDKLPTVNGVAWTPEALLHHIRLNINDFLDHEIAHFEPYEPKYNPASLRDKQRWESQTPEGAVVSIDMKALRGFLNLDDGSVVCSLFDTKRWIFSTLHTPEDGAHPVSGNREFGFFRTEEGWTMFYIRGADRATELHHDMANVIDVVFGAAEDLWKSYQKNLVKFIVDNGGSASILKHARDQFAWGAVKLMVFKPTVPRVR